jgi:hypothetical protein
VSTTQQSAAGARCQGKSTSGERARESSLLRGQRSARDIRRVGNQAVIASLRATGAQAKLSVNTPGDRYEREADRVADAVMRAPAAAAAPVGDSISRFTPKVTAAPAAQRRCAACDDEAQRKESAGGEVSGAAALPAGVGQPLTTTTRGFFEPRFGADLSGVRVHTGAESHASARSLNALAYTVGSDIVFANGTYAPHSSSGRHLLAHELTHVIQQRGIGRRIQRACSGAVPMPPGCAPTAITPPSMRFLFNVNCDTYAPGEETRLATTIAGLSSGTTVRIVGLASADQPAADPTLNQRLACRRAEEGVRVVSASLPSGVIMGAVDSTGGVPGSNGDATMRAVGIVITPKGGPGPGPGPGPEPVPEPQVPRQPNCGPDATQWFVDQVNAAAVDPAVLAIRRDMSAARSIAVGLGVSLDELAEGGAVTAVQIAEAARVPRIGTPSGPPPRTRDASRQIRAGSASRTSAAIDMALASLNPFNRPDIILMNGLLARAAAGWAALVTHRARYDFKMHRDSMHMPHAPGCPDEACPPGEHGTITFCPGTNPRNCYESDMPGNMFYALIGRHVGMTELTLQLGSQLAELMDGPRPGRPRVTWDTSDDTASISSGFTLRPPLTVGSLCGVVGPARPTLQQRNDCDDCLSDARSGYGGSAVIR